MLKKIKSIKNTINIILKPISHKKDEENFQKIDILSVCLIMFSIGFIKDLILPTKTISQPYYSLAIYAPIIFSILTMLYNKIKIPPIIFYILSSIIGTITFFSSIGPTNPMFAIIVIPLFISSIIAFYVLGIFLIKFSKKLKIIIMPITIMIIIFSIFATYDTYIHFIAKKTQISQICDTMPNNQGFFGNHPYNKKECLLSSVDKNRRYLDHESFEQIRSLEEKGVINILDCNYLQSSKARHCRLGLKDSEQCKIMDKKNLKAFVGSPAELCFKLQNN